VCFEGHGGGVFEGGATWLRATVAWFEGGGVWLRPVAVWLTDSMRAGRVVEGKGAMRVRGVGVLRAVVAGV